MKKMIFNTSYFRELFIRKGLPVRRAALEAGISRSSMIGFLSGKMIPKLETVNILADFLGVDPRILYKVVDDEKK